jgi:hypothetical protein
VRLKKPPLCSLVSWKVVVNSADTDSCGVMVALVPPISVCTQPGQNDTAKIPSFSRSIANVFVN